jgi:hypothetical protein
MRLRQVLLMVIVLVWASVPLVTHHGGRHGPAAPSLGGAPQPSDPPARRTALHGGHSIRAASAVRAVRVKRHLQAPRSTRTPSPDAELRTAARTAGRAVWTAIREDARLAGESPPPPPEPLAITDARVLSVRPSSARISWRTNVPSATQAAFGLDAPTIWTESTTENVVEHESALTGMEPSTTYRVFVRAVDEWNRAETETLTLTTEAMPETSSAHTESDRILVDDRPFFGRAVWKQCSDGFASNIDDGINLFLGEGCSRNDHELSHGLAGRAYSLLSADDADAEGRGVIGWYYPDEWDAFLASSVERRDLEGAIVAPRAGRVSFLTLTNHFYSRAEPLPQGKGMYPLLFTIPDVIGFDLYPLQGWCRRSFGDVLDAQRELASSSGRPTFQWIEVAPMEHDCGRVAALDPTPATVRAEAWLAIAGGADSVGYFPNRWSRTIGAEVARINDEIKALTPALLAEPVDASSSNTAIRVAGRKLNGAVYVIAVNTSEVIVQAEISVEGIGLADSFGPLTARVYVIPPDGW